jgi:hypothetical protein
MQASDERMSDRAMEALRICLETSVGLVLALFTSASGGATAQTFDGARAGNGA